MWSLVDCLSLVNFWETFLGEVAGNPTKKNLPFRRTKDLKDEMICRLHTRLKEWIATQTFQMSLRKSFFLNGIIYNMIQYVPMSISISLYIYIYIYIYVYTPLSLYIYIYIHCMYNWFHNISYIIAVYINCWLRASNPSNDTRGYRLWLDRSGDSLSICMSDILYWIESDRNCS